MPGPHSIDPIPWGDMTPHDPGPSLLETAIYGYDPILAAMDDSVATRGSVNKLVLGMGTSAMVVALATGTVGGKPGRALAETTPPPSVFVMGDSIMEGVRDAGLADELASRGIGVTDIIAQQSKRMEIAKCNPVPPTDACLTNPDGRTILQLNQDKIGTADLVVVNLGTNGDTSSIRQQTYDLGTTANQLGIGPDGKAPETAFIGMFGKNPNVDAVNRSAEVQAAVDDLNANGYPAIFIPTYDFAETTLRPANGIAQPKDLPDVHPNKAGYDLLKTYIADQVAAAATAYHSVLYPSVETTPVTPEPTPTPVEQPVAPSPTVKNPYIDITFPGTPNSVPLPDAPVKKSQYLDLRFGSVETPALDRAGDPLKRSTPQYLDLSYSTPDISPVSAAPTDPAVTAPPVQESPLPSLTIPEAPTEIAQPARLLPDTNMYMPPVDQAPAPEERYSGTGLLVPENYSGSTDAQLLLPIGDPAYISDNGEYKAQRKSYKHAGIDFTQHNPSGWADVYSPVDGVIESIDRETNPDHPDAGVNLVIATYIDPAVLAARGIDDAYGIVYLQERELTDGSIPDGLEVGSEVTAGQVVGGFGHGATSGASEGPHVHFGITAEDPLTDPRGMATRATDGYTYDPALFGFREPNGTVVEIQGDNISYPGTPVTPLEPTVNPLPTPTGNPISTEPPGHAWLDLDGATTATVDLLPGLSEILDNPIQPLQPTPDPEDTPDQDPPEDSVLPDIPIDVGGQGRRHKHDKDTDADTGDEAPVVPLVPGDTEDPPEDSGDEMPIVPPTTEPAQPPDAGPPTEEAPAEPEQPTDPVSDSPPVAEPPQDPSAVEPGSAIVPHEGLKGDTVPEQMENFFRDYGLNNAGIAGLMANGTAEGGLQPSRMQTTWNGNCAEPPERLDPNSRDKNAGGTKGIGVGVWQFTDKGYQDALQALADQMGSTWDDPLVQFTYMASILDAKPELREILMTTDDPAVASTAVLTKFEKPAETHKQITPRENIARDLFDVINNGQTASLDVSCDGVGKD